MTQRQADWILASISIAWGSSNLMLRLGLEGIETFNLIALRFGIAFLVLGVVCGKKIRNIAAITWRYSALIGFAVYGNFWVLIWALQCSTVSEVGFLTSTSVVLVPLFCSVFRRELPENKILLAMAVVAVGLALMNLDQGIRLTAGTWLSLLAAVINASIVILTGFASKRVDSALQLGVLQVGFTGAFGLITTIFFETPTWPQTGVQWCAVLVLAIVCSAFGFVMRPIALKYTTPERAGFLHALEPVFSTLFGFLILHEVLKPASYIGAGLVLLAPLIANSDFGGGKKRRGIRAL